MQAIANQCKVKKKNHFFPALRDDRKEPAASEPWRRWVAFGSLRKATEGPPGGGARSESVFICLPRRLVRRNLGEGGSFGENGSVSASRPVNPPVGRPISLPNTSPANARFTRPVFDTFYVNTPRLCTDFGHSQPNGSCCFCRARSLNTI
jgi:hypothetical protein